MGNFFESIGRGIGGLFRTDPTAGRLYNLAQRNYDRAEAATPLSTATFASARGQLADLMRGQGAADDASLAARGVQNGAYAIGVRAQRGRTAATGERAALAQAEAMLEARRQSALQLLFGAGALKSQQRTAAQQMLGAAGQALPLLFA